METLSVAYSEWYWFQEMVIWFSVLKQCFSKRSGSNFMHDDLQCSVQTSHQIISSFNGKNCGVGVAENWVTWVTPQYCPSVFKVDLRLIQNTRILRIFFISINWANIEYRNVESVFKAIRISLSGKDISAKGQDVWMGDDRTELADTV